MTSSLGGADSAVGMNYDRDANRGLWKHRLHATAVLLRSVYNCFDRSRRCFSHNMAAAGSTVPAPDVT